MPFRFFDRSSYEMTKNKQSRAISWMGSGHGTAEIIDNRPEAIMRKRLEDSVLQKKGEHKKAREPIVIDALNVSWLGSIVGNFVHFDDLDSKLRSSIQVKFKIGGKTPDIVKFVSGVDPAKATEEDVIQIGDVFSLNPPQGYKSPEELASGETSRVVKDLSNASGNEINAFQSAVKKACKAKKDKYITDASGDPLIIMDLSLYQNWLGHLPPEAGGVYVFDGKGVSMVLSM